MFRAEARWLRIIPAAFLMYTIAYIDRTNFSLAIPSLQREFQFTAQFAGVAAGVFFFGYFLFQIPGGYLGQVWSAKRFVFWALLVWGLFATLCGLARTPNQLLLFRFCLGLGEGGVWPATVVLLASWFPPEERARANGYWVLCQPVAIIVSSPLSGWILDHYDWRIMFIVQGLLPIAFAAVWWWAVEDSPSQAAWLSQAERADVEARLSLSRSTGAYPQPEGRWGFLSNRSIQIFIVMDIAFACGAYGLLMWLPSAIRTLHGSSNLVLGILAALPYTFAIIGSIYNSRHSDLKRERRWHVAVPCIVAGLSLFLGATAGVGFPMLALTLLCLTGFGVYASIGPMWAMLTEMLPPASAGIALGLINGLANLGGFAGPYAVGALRDLTSSFYSGFVFLSACLITAGLCALLIRRQVPTSTRMYKTASPVAALPPE